MLASSQQERRAYLRAPTKAEIAEWAEVHFEKDGKYPTQASGQVYE
jgi:hypothetical protein